MNIAVIRLITKETKLISKKFIKIQVKNVESEIQKEMDSALLAVLQTEGEKFDIKVKSFLSFKDIFRNLRTFKADDITLRMREMFSRIWLTAPEKEMTKRFNKKIMLCGLGISSNLIPHLIKEGFITIGLIDGDIVEHQNILRQRFESLDIGKPKAEVLYERYKREFPFSRLSYVNEYLEHWSTKLLLKESGVDYMVNAIDFDSEAYLSSHKLAHMYCGLELFPFVLGDIGVVIAVDRTCPTFEEYFKTSNPEEMKFKIIQHCIDEVKKSCDDYDRNQLDNYFNEYLKSGLFHHSDPQCDNAVQKIASLIVSILKKDTRNEGKDREKLFKLFPEINFY